MSKKCNHEEWNPCGNNYYCCTKCGILRTSQQVNLYLEKDKQILNLQSKLAEKKQVIKSLQEINQSLGQTCNNDAKEIERLRKEVEEKERLIERLQQIIDKLRDKKFAGETLVNAVYAVYEPLYQNKCDEVEELKKQLHFEEQGHKLSIQYFENKFKQSPNKIAIKELEEIINLFEPYENGEKDTILCANNGISFLEYVENKINELKGIRTGGKDFRGE